MNPRADSGIAAFKAFAARFQAESTHLPAQAWASLLDGQAAASLRELVPLEIRRNLGAFFTPEHMAMKLAEPLRDYDGRLVIVDTSCGGGDLLLAAIRSVSAVSSRRTGPLTIRGVDLVPEFAQVTANRLRAQSELSGMPLKIQVRCGNGRSAPELLEATHLLLNPPFTPTLAVHSCKWAGGKVNSAAVFLADAVEHARPGTVVRAILPEVLPRRHEIPSLAPVY